MIALTLQFVACGLICLFAALYVRSAFKNWRKKFVERLRLLRILAAHNMVGRAATPLNSANGRIKDASTDLKQSMSTVATEREIPKVFHENIDYTRFDMNAYLRKHGRLPSWQESNVAPIVTESIEPNIGETMSVYH